jgi:hypothetical protein
MVNVDHYTPETDRGILSVWSDHNQLCPHKDYKGKFTLALPIIASN